MPHAPRRIGRFELPPPIGLGCMNLSHAYGTPPPFADAERLLLHALDRGVTLFDTAALQGFGADNPRTVQGERYAAATLPEVDTERFGSAG